MKFAAVVLALAAAVSAQAPPPNLEAIMAAMPNDLVAAMSYFPATFIQGIFNGSPMPTDVAALFALAPAIPTADRPKLESQYLQFLAQVAPLLPTPTKPTVASSPSSSPKPTSGSSSPSSSPSSVPSSVPSSSHSGSHSGSSSGSSKAGQSSDSEKKTDSSDSNKSSDSHSGDDISESDSSSDSGSSSKNNGAAKVAASLVALVAVAAGAMF
ncbi:hypothetical protein GGI03_002434 [Coemansia sp. RSA 2337]|nr:hypothetical protein H4S03_001859 [Coemansia sp. S3946]KAJ2075521.1 hypothetical protein GGH13_000561 [Coemansia sp. S155-1]KAJ2465841.1 hypothetical protein GGI03_002434 [Coemansia sp. RSA 2337]